MYEGRKHKVSIVYKPGGDYSLFTIKGWIDANRAEALTEQYRKRWTVENKFKTMKANFLPQTASKDYRIRFIYFIVGCIMYNIWRLANFVLRDEVNVDFGDDPPILGGEIVELVGFFLFDPGYLER